MKRELQGTIGKLGSPVAVIGALMALVVSFTSAAATVGWRATFIVVCVGCLAWLFHVLGAHEPDAFNPPARNYEYDLRTRWLAVLVALVALIPGVPAVYSLCVPRSPVHVESPILISRGSRSGLSIVLKNTGETTRAVVHLQVVLAQTGGNFMMIGSTTYVIAGSLGADGVVAGSARPAGAGAGVTAVEYPVTGGISTGASGWGLGLEVPIRVEIEAGRFQELNVVLPDTLEVTGTSGSINPVAPTLDSYIVKGRFQLRKFLADVGAVSVVVAVVDTDGLRASSRAGIDFPD